jgi:hypothetical protein
MAKPILAFSASSGLNVKVDPARLPYNPKTGVQDLAVAVNIDHDSTGRPSRRKGFAATVRTEAAHSMFCEGGECVFVTGTSLCVLDSSYGYASVATVTAGARLAAMQLNNAVYWLNGYEKGYIKDSVNYSWIKGDYVGPDTTRQLSDPPIGSRLAYFNGRIYVAQGNVLWYSEPYATGAFDLARNFIPFEERIRMVRPVRDGIFVGTDKRTIFLVGDNPRDVKFIEVADYPPIEGTDAKLDLSITGLEVPEFSGSGAIWTSEKGICVGSSGGLFINVTRRKLSYPRATFGAGLFIEANEARYVATLEP